MGDLLECSHQAWKEESRMLYEHDKRLKRKEHPQNIKPVILGTTKGGEKIYH